MFKRKKEIDSIIASDQAETRDWNSPEQIRWRQEYDKERSKALQEGRSCGKCIDSIVKFGPKEDDKAQCTGCSLLQKSGINEREKKTDNERKGSR